MVNNIIAQQKDKARVTAQLSLNLFGDKFILYPNGLTVNSNPSEQEYDEAFRRLSLIESATAWWYGDLANARERDYGSLKELAERIDISYSSLQNYQWVSHQYKLSNRLDSLSFKHHMIATPLEDRLDWLKQAEREGWSASRLRYEISSNQKRIQRLILPPGTFNVIYIDPPWKYFDTHMKSWGPTDLHYDSLEVPEIANYIDPAGTNVQEKFEKDTALFLWATNPKLRQAFELIDNWGFEYKTNIVWVKQNLKRPGSGYYVRGHHELLFICSRGSIVPDQTGKSPVSSVFETSNVLYADIGEHSQKPAEVYKLIESLYPVNDGYRYLELYARQRRNNWESWGDQLEGI